MGEGHRWGGGGGNQKEKIIQKADEKDNYRQKKEYGKEEKI